MTVGTQINPWTWQDARGFSQAWRVEGPQTVVFLSPTGRWWDRATSRRRPGRPSTTSGRCSTAQADPAAPPTTAELHAHVRERLAPRKTPKDWFFMAHFPVNAMGKLQKFQVREAITAGGLDRLPG